MVKVNVNVNVKDKYGLVNFSIYVGSPVGVL